MNKLAYLLARIYLTFAYNFAPFLINRSLKKRKGYCRECGHCCGNCIFLYKNRCVAYNSRPNFCHVDFPVNRFELKYLASKDCGYRFK